MPRNGSGTYNVPNTFTSNTVISSAAVNGNFTDAGAAITDSLPRDGQAGMTGPLRASVGTVAIPSISFTADTDTGIYRAGPNNMALVAGGAAVVDVTTSGIDVTGTLSASGKITSSAGQVSADGTVALPAYSFTADTDTGIYRIGANNIGVAANGAKVLDIATTGLSVTGSATVSSGFTVSAGTVSLPAATVANAALATDNFATKAQMEAATSTTVAVPPGTMQNHPAMPKAWGYVTISGNVPTIAASSGVSNVAFVSAGFFDVTLTTAMSSTNYAVLTTSQSSSRIAGYLSETNKTASTFRLLHFRTDDSAALNPFGFSFVVLGDQ